MKKNGIGNRPLCLNLPFPRTRTGEAAQRTQTYELILSLKHKITNKIKTSLLANSLEVTTVRDKTKKVN